MILTIAGIALAIGGADTPPVPLLGGVTPDRVAAALRPSRSVHASSIRRAATPPRTWQPFMECVIARESGGNPAAVNASSNAAGLAQWLPAWESGLPFVVRRGLVQAGVPPKVATSVRRELSSRPIHRWPALYQRVGMAQVLREGGRDAALRHWSLPGSRCEGLVPR